MTDGLGKDILVFQEEHPSFVSNYFNDRKIIKTARFQKAIIATVLEDDKSTPVAGVKVTITAAAGASKPAPGAKPEVFKKKTTAKGGFHITNMPVGSYEIKLEKLGFQSQTFSVNVLDGETANLKLVLAKGLRVNVLGCLIGAGLGNSLFFGLVVRLTSLNFENVWKVIDCKK